MRLMLPAILLVGVYLLIGVATAKTTAPDVKTLRRWVEEMKEAPRGPFKRLRFFCNDGTIQPPKAYSCRGHGGGIQHGEWSARTKALRARGYYIANLLVDIDPNDFMRHEHYEEILKQILLEQFLINADNGWIFRRARYYWGALQAEDEEKSARDLLLALVEKSEWRISRFSVLREAVRLLPHGQKGAPFSEMRQLSLSIAKRDPGFQKLRVKIHVKPEEGDAKRVRAYGKGRGIRELSKDYERLAIIIEKVYRPQENGTNVLSLAGRVKDPGLAKALKKGAARLSAEKDLSIRFVTASALLALLRDNLHRVGGATLMLDFLDAGLGLEGEAFRCGNKLLERLHKASRRDRLLWLQNSTAALYGMGLISKRQWGAVDKSLTMLVETPPSSLITYKAELDYISRISGWADRLLRFHFSEAVEHLSDIEPLTRNYIHDRLRGSLLLIYASVLESLLGDANRLLGIRHEFFGKTVVEGLRGQNPGLARGVLRFFREGEKGVGFDGKGIYVLPAITADLTPVAGILTAGQGNSLSHVQLLARNLGIPNVVVDKKHLPDLEAKEGHQVVLAVSPRGVVKLVEDGPKWNSIFDGEKTLPDFIIRPDLKKLDLENRHFINLNRLRASDSGRIVGPKAANLGELKSRFPDAVTDGLVIPFGFFRALLDQPIEPGGPTVFQWIQGEYGAIRSMKENPARREEASRHLLKRIRNRITQAELGGNFRERLRSAMAEVFGDDGTYGVFVRSDTNVEDLPGFTGAGLNLTVPNVVGFENVMEAIARVWASPFQERAFYWRQAHMENPVHVYVSVLLMRSVPVEKSGVMVTADLERGLEGWLSVAVNDGVGGAVDSQATEELRIDMENTEVRLMAQATEPLKRILLPEGGVAKIRASGAESVLNRGEIEKLIELAGTLPAVFPSMHDDQGQSIPADIEFGFHGGRLALFQIRPFLESSRARQSLYLKSLDKDLNKMRFIKLNIDEAPRGEYR